MPIASCSICFEGLVSQDSSRRSSSEGSSDAQQNDEIQNRQDVSATPCGHVFHTGCVSAWIQQHRHCPQCRNPVLNSMLVKLFLAEDSPKSRLGRDSEGSSGRFDTFIVVPGDGKQGKLKTHFQTFLG